MIFVLILVIVNGLFAMSEIAVVSSRKARLQVRADGGDANAQSALALARSPDKFLSTVQVGITLIGILAGAVGGETMAAALAPLLEKVPFLAPYSASVSLAIVVSIITYFQLVIGELAPKQIGISNAENIDHVNGDGLAGGWNTHKLTLMGAGPGHVQYDFVTFGDKVLNCGFDVGESTMQHSKQRFGGLTTRWYARWKFLMFNEIRCK